MTLDDLLDQPNDAVRPPKAHTLRRRIVVATVQVVVISGLIYTILERLTVGTSFVLVVAVVGALFALRDTLRVLDIRPLPPTLRINPAIAQADTARDDDGMNIAAGAWSRRIDYAHDDPADFARMVQPPLIEIIEERVRLRHGVSRQSDPERFRAIVGPELWKFMAAPSSKKMTPHVMATLVAQMEAL